MKNSITVGAALLLALGTLVGCNSEADRAAANKAVVLAAVEAMNNQQYDSLDLYFAPDLKRHCQATPDVEVNSLDEMIPFVKSWYAAFPDMRSETRLVAAEDDLVALWGTFVGTHEGPMGDIPATGGRMESETFAFFRVADGKIAEMWVTWDNVAILKQLGLFPAPPPEAEEG